VNSDLAPSVLPTAATTAVTGSPVGNYSITLSGASDANYSINYVSGTLTIIKAILTIRAENKTKTQGDPNPAFTFTYSGFVTGENPTSLTTLPIATCSAKNNSAVGSYPIIPAGGVAANYTFVYQNGTLTITAPLIMKFEIPNAFIPTDIYVDNRYLKASYNASVQKVISFRIYNRMGKLVYELQNVNPAEIKWDGKFNDVLQESDVYMWIANVDGHLDPFRGQFLLLK
jgi:gliding motility-associated-like protein